MRDFYITKETMTSCILEKEQKPLMYNWILIIHERNTNYKLPKQKSKDVEQ